jgi:uncharacterized protein
MASKVYFAAVGGHYGEGPLDKIRMLFEAAGFEELIKERDLVALKCHFGEPGNSTFIPPVYIRRIVDEVHKRGGRAFLTDTGCLYFSKRYNARDHLVAADQHGFSVATTGAPVLIADGLRGSDVTPVRVGLKHFDTVDVASAIHDASSFMVVSHLTGHGLTGLAGTIKNLGMGAAGRRMKMAVHSQVRPSVDPEKCTLCEECLENCPTGAISIENDVIVFDHDTCHGCGECFALCSSHAIKIMWQGDPQEAQEKLAEITLGVLANKKGRVGFWNFLINITSLCDCWNFSSAPAVPDIGFLASRDPVAIDQASADLVMRSLMMETPSGGQPSGETADTFLSYHGTGWNRQLAYAQEIGLGSREYELVRVGG